jgi:hypothetical protein
MLREEDVRREPRARVAVVALEDRLTRLTRQVIQEEMPEGILLV